MFRCGKGCSRAAWLGQPVLHHSFCFLSASLSASWSTPSLGLAGVSGWGPCCCTTPWHGLAAAPALGMALLQHQPLGRPCCSTSPWEGLAAAPALGRALLLHQPLGGPCCCTSLGGPCCCTSPWEALVAAPVWEGLVAAPTLGTALLQHQPYAFLLHPASCLQQCACLAAV